MRVHTSLAVRPQAFEPAAAPPQAAAGLPLPIAEPLHERRDQRADRPEAHLRRFADHSTSVIWVVDAASGSFDYLSPAFDRVWGFPAAAVLVDPARWLASIHPDDHAVLSAWRSRVLLGETVSGDYRIVRSDGAIRCISATEFPIPDRDGRIRLAGGIACDTTADDDAFVYVVAEDAAVADASADVLVAAGYHVTVFTPADFLALAATLRPGCVVVDGNGEDDVVVAALTRLRSRSHHLPAIVLHRGDVRSAVRVMQAGAVDVVPATAVPDHLLAAVAQARAAIRPAAALTQQRNQAQVRIDALSERERAVLMGIVGGGTNKSIAKHLGISPRTVEIHRAHVMERLGVKTLPEAVLMAADAGLRPPGRGV